MATPSVWYMKDENEDEDEDEDEDDFDITYTLSEARKARQVVERRKQELWELIEQHGYEYTPITHFYHVTRSHLKDSILEEQYLKRSEISLYRDSINSPAHENLKGVFFTCNLRDGEYPEISPYGTKRVKIPIKDFFKKGEFKLFFNSFHFTSVSNCCAVMVMVRKTALEYEFCRDFLVPLDLKSNKFLRLDFLRQRYSCCQLQYSFIQLWLELIVVDDVPIKYEYEWDTVKKIGNF